MFKFVSKATSPEGFPTISSVVLVPCMPELIKRRDFPALADDVDQATKELEKKPSLSSKLIIYDFLCKVVSARDDAEQFLSEEIILMAIMDMIEARRNRWEGVYFSVSRLLYHLARLYPDLVITELLNTDQPLPQYVFQTLGAVTTRANMTTSGILQLLSALNSQMPDVRSNERRRDCCWIIMNCILAVSTRPQRDQRVIEHHLMTSLDTLYKWRYACCGHRVVETIKKAIVLLNSFLQFDAQVLKDQIEFLAAENLANIQIWMKSGNPYFDPEILLLSESRHKQLVKEYARAQTWDCQNLFCLVAPLLQSPVAYNKLTALTLLSELMTYQSCLSKIQIQGIIEGILDMDHAGDVKTHSRVVDCIKTAVLFHPKQLRKYKYQLARILFQGIGEDSTELLGNCMETLINMLPLFKGSGMSMKIVMEVDSFFRHEDSEIQLLTTRLFGEAVRRCPSFPLSRISVAVKENLLSVILQLHSSDPRASVAAMQCARHCLPHLCWRPRLAGVENIEGIYQVLAQRDLLKPLLFQAINRLPQGAQGEAIFKHLNVLKDYLPYNAMTQQDIKTVWEGLRRGMDDPNPSVIQTAREAAAIIRRSPLF